MTHFAERTEKNDRLIYEATSTHSRSAPYCAMAIIVDRGGKRELTRLSDLTDDEYTNALNDKAPCSMLVQQIARMTPYGEEADDSIGAGPSGADAIDTLNALIAKARELTA